MPRTASHLRRPGDAGTYGARSARAEHPEAKAAGAQIFHFQLQIRRGERVVVEPPRRKAHFERARSGRQLDRRQRGAAAAAMQQHREAQQHDRVERVALPGRHELLHPLEAELAPMRSHEARQQPLLLAREARHVAVLEEVRAVAVVAAVGDVEPDLVQSRGPLERQVRQRLIESPRLARLLEEVAHGRFDALGLLEVDVIALLHRAYRELARIFALVAAEHVVQQAFAHRAFGDPHVLDVEHAEHFGENRESPGNTGRRSSVIGSSLSSRVWPASIEYSMARLIPAGVMASAWGSSARIESPIARTVPELPAQASQPRRRNAACTGSSSRRAARRARSMRLAEILPSRKKRSLKATHPICRLSMSSGVSPSPMMSSVLPPPMSTTRRFPGSLGMVCATPE